MGALSVTEGIAPCRGAASHQAGTAAVGNDRYCKKDASTATAPPPRSGRCSPVRANLSQ